MELLIDGIPYFPTRSQQIGRLKLGVIGNGRDQLSVIFKVETLGSHRISNAYAYTLFFARENQCMQSILFCKCQVVRGCGGRITKRSAEEGTLCRASC